MMGNSVIDRSARRYPSIRGTGTTRTACDLFAPVSPILVKKPKEKRIGIRN
ncbi:hypothetical protein [Zavarzinella formosa]|uniref:hypothetical protein n=1 Tax=Zavarzinella formosa TaxID=360055 RepID=UPI0002F1B4AD|nr:hypothetical protein [Zavarzinella formosa]